jgi:hypothetical protein
MKKIIKSIGFIFLVMLLVVSACKKDEETEAQPQKTTTDYLTAGYWKTTAMTIDPGINFGGTVITDFYAQMLPCSKDDLTRFNANGTITDDEGATKCDVNDPQTTNDGTWVLSADNKSITLTYPGEEPITIVFSTINATTLSGTYVVVEDFGSGPIVYTFSVSMTLQ